MDPVERAKALAGGIGLLTAGLMLFPCVVRLGETDFDMQACALPVIPQLAVPNIRLVLVLALLFSAVAVVSWIDDGKF
ncbi:hypothetical protein AUR64_18380 [Haloprofundus marisrubri]|uniref:Uncharacterized protein n=1 Tax=Haloprofundus marisrubri TaxID=1514971 RepID=A0A0W1R5E2_9EURY|nr:hypothetical protein [Haloprofundus marisrubri]KTG08633.1 hypothetical protein AUR64_18380 [Haloprofundus marisrubri]